MPLTATINASVQALLSSSPTALGDASIPTGLGFGKTLTSGTASGQADVVWSATRTIAASGTDDLDLVGTLTGLLGGTVTFVRVKGIIVTADAGNTNNVVIGGATSNQFVGPFGAATHTHSVQAGGLYAAAAPGATAWPVTASTGDIFRIANSGAGTPVTYSIVIVGASA